jgi:hypothetical protein
MNISERRLYMPRFTSANAKQMAARSLATRRATKMERERQPAPAPVQTDPSATGESSFPRLRLMRVRGQLTRLDVMMMEESTKKTPDTKKLKELADAAHRLQEQERILDNRPLPGSRRHKPDSGRPAYRPLREPVICLDDGMNP